MSDRPPSLARKALVVVGGAMLFAAVATDALAVVGRHVGRPLLGSIEIVQAVVLVASSVALVVATLDRRHATVHLIVNRMAPDRQVLLARLGRALGALLFLGFLVGSAWIAWDMRGGHEESELLRIPFGPLRLIELAGLLAVCIIFAVQAIRERRS